MRKQGEERAAARAMRWLCGLWTSRANRTQKWVVWRSDDIRVDPREECCVQRRTAPPARRTAHGCTSCWWGFTSFELGSRSALQSPARQEGMEACGSTQGGTRWRSF